MLYLLLKRLCHLELECLREYRNEYCKYCSSRNDVAEGKFRPVIAEVDVERSRLDA
jgi:hypothetical protein